MDLKLKIKCSCSCSYTIDQSISGKEVSCPNCGKVPSFSNKVVEMLNIAKEIPDFEKSDGINNLSIRVLSLAEYMTD